MNATLTDISIAAVLLIVAAILVVWIRRYMAAGSERRMLRMLDRLGVDPAVAASGDKAAIMAAVRSRCRQCQSEALCERWLAGQETGGNEFCPNAEVFEMLGKKGQVAG